MLTFVVDIEIGTDWQTWKNLKKCHRQPISEAKNHRELTHAHVEYSCKAADLEMRWFLTYSSANGEKAQTAWVVAQNLKKNHCQPISEAKNHRTLTCLCAEYSRKVAVLETGWFLRRTVKSFNIMVFTIFSCSPYFIIFFSSISLRCAVCTVHHWVYAYGVKVRSNAESYFLAIPSRYWV